MCNVSGEMILFSNASELHLDVGNRCVEISLCLAAVYLTGGGGGLNGGGKSILKTDRERER